MEFEDQYFWLKAIWSVCSVLMTATPHVRLKRYDTRLTPMRVERVAPLSVFPRAPDRPNARDPHILSRSCPRWRCSCCETALSRPDRHVYPQSQPTQVSSLARRVLGRQQLFFRERVRSR